MHINENKHTLNCDYFYVVAKCGPGVMKGSHRLVTRAKVQLNSTFKERKDLQEPVEGVCAAFMFKETLR